MLIVKKLHIYILQIIKLYNIRYCIFLKDNVNYFIHIFIYINTQIYIFKLNSKNVLNN